MKTIARTIILGATLLLLLASPVLADAEVTDESKVYYGFADDFESPAVIDAAKVFMQIPEYRRILKEELTPHDALYWMLLTKATKRFYGSVAKAAEAAGYDLVAEIGSVEVEDGEVPDITAAVIAQVKLSK